MGRPAGRDGGRTLNSGDGSELLTNDDQKGAPGDDIGEADQYSHWKWHAFEREQDDKTAHDQSSGQDGDRFFLSRATGGQSWIGGHFASGSRICIVVPVLPVWSNAMSPW